MAKIVILGAGPTGLSAAYHLEQLGFFDYKLFEKEKTVGGLCRSVNQDGFTFDFTGHLLHLNNSYAKNFIESIVTMDNFEVIQRRSYVYSQNIYTRYPYQINLYGLPASTIVECIEGYIKRTVSKKKPTNFREWVLQNFGPGFGKYFFFPYQKKIFSYDIKKLSASWMGRFVPSTSLQDLIQGAVLDRADEHFGYNAQFFYPKTGGIEFWIKKLAQKIENNIYTEHGVESVDAANKIIKFTNGLHEPYDILITTIPLDFLLTNMHEPSSSNLSKAADNLLCNSVVNFNLGIKRDTVSTKHWIYFPEKEYPFYRLGFPHNFSPHMAPPGSSSLYGEFSYIKKPKIYIHKMLTDALGATKKLLKLEDNEIITQKIITIDRAYVIYNSWRDKHIDTILSRLQKYNIYSVGRYGQWKYSSMQDAILDGQKIADTLIPKI